MQTVGRILATASAVVLMLLATGGVAWADFSTDKALADVKSIGKFLLGALFVVFIVVGVGVIIQALVDARKQGGWGSFLVGVLMVFVGAFAMWSLLSMAGQDPNAITQSIQITK